MKVLSQSDWDALMATSPPDRAAFLGLPEDTSLVGWQPDTCLCRFVLVAGKAVAGIQCKEHDGAEYKTVVAHNAEFGKIADEGKRENAKSAEWERIRKLGEK